MNLCHIVPSLQEQHGGPSKSVRALCGALARAGHAVDLFATAPEGSVEGRVEPQGQLSVRVFRRDWPQRICRSRGLRHALAHRPADVVHHHAIWLRTLDYARRRAAVANVPLVISPRGMMSTWAWAHRGWRKQLSRALIHPGAFARASGWHATSVAEEREIRALGFAQPICVAPNGVDAPGASEIATAAGYWRQTCGAVNASRVALFYSRFHRKKRVLELIDWWCGHAPAGWFLLLVGIPEDYSVEMLQQHIRDRAGGARIAVFSGAERPVPYPVASLFLLPSHNENFGLVIAEAMAHGVPVVVTDTTPWAEINTDDIGWCVPWPEFPAAALRAMAEPAERVAARGRRAREWVLREYAWDKSAAKLLRFYEELRPRISA